MSEYQLNASASGLVSLNMMGLVSRHGIAPPRQPQLTAQEVEPEPNSQRLLEDYVNRSY